MSAELKSCITWFIYFFDLLQVRSICAKFQHCKICVTDFKDGDFFGAFYPCATSKRPILNRVKVVHIKETISAHPSWSSHSKEIQQKNAPKECSRHVEKHSHWCAPSTKTGTQRYRNLNSARVLPIECTGYPQNILP